MIFAMLQLGVTVLLARSLTPAEFAFASTAIALLMIMIALNGFGIIRQIEYRRSLDAEDPELPLLFIVRLRYSYASGVVWALGCLALWLVVKDGRFLILLPAAIWLVIEQITQVWNGISIIDGKSHLLIPSYVSRRLPQVLCLAAGLHLGLDGLSCLVTGMVIGALISYVQGWFTQESWARALRPISIKNRAARVGLDIPYWFSQVGEQVRDLDVAVVALVSTSGAGIYALPARLVRPMNLVTQAGGMVAFPHMVRRPKVSRRQLCLFLAAGTVPVLVASLAVFLAAPLVPMLVGTDYVDSVPVLQILAVTALLSGPSILLCFFLQARGRSAVRSAGLIMLIGNLALLPCVYLGALNSGAIGAAVGALIGQGLIFVALLARGFFECGVGVGLRGPRRSSLVTADEGKPK
ncbi:lipopolysaccharide biosynthesis protein [Mycolicibacterium rutilum]|uniref:lipopolysaccharide biosynthesis protein n=1 Tax=Mycolicibacterium rutilum TaxID=370526 RepID=UPI0009F1A8D3|nr:hypothetical protein [Mycolicibacterium rutilum]